jgi:hypothetical protein
MDRESLSINAPGYGCAIKVVMKARSIDDAQADPALASAGRQQIPLWLKLAYTAFMAVLIPVYLTNYGPINFLYFCDIALLLTLAGIWTENRLLVSLPAVGILIPQALWVVDFMVQLSGHRLTGMTGYMFDQNRSLFLRGLSLFHGWLPFLLVYLVAKLGYDRRALPLWTMIAWSVCVICFYFLPPAGAHLASAKLPTNINYVFGFDDAHPQTWMVSAAYLAFWMMVLLVCAFVPAHLALRRLSDVPLVFRNVSAGLWRWISDLSRRNRIAQGSQAS